MKVTKEIIEHTAKLSRIRLGEEEKEKLESELSGILDYVDQLKNVDTRSVEPTHQVTELSDRIRPDEITEKYERSRMLANTEEKDERFLKVKNM